MKFIPLRYLILAVLALCSCRRQPALTLLLQNQHPGIATTEIRVSFVPRTARANADVGSEKLLWSGSIPYSQDPRQVYKKTVPLSVEIPPGIDCCVRIALSLKGEIYSDSKGSWKAGENFEHITIQNQNGIYVRSEGSTSFPDQLSDFQLTPMD